MKLNKSLVSILFVPLVLTACSENMQKQLETFSAAFPGATPGSGSASSKSGKDCGQAGGFIDLASRFGFDSSKLAKGQDLLCFIASDLIGAEFAQVLKSEEDQKELYRAQQQAARGNQTVAFKGSGDGVSGRVSVIENRPNERASAKVRVTQVLKEKVSPFPTLDFIGENYRSNGVNMRVGPGTNYQKVVYVKPGEVVSIIGKVSGKNWFAVSKDGSGTMSGFVSSSSRFMQPTDQQLTSLNTVADTTAVEQDVELSVSCKVVRQEVNTPDGALVKDKKVCQQPDGTFKIS